MARVLPTLVAIVALAAAAAAAHPRKQLAGPPSEFAQHALPQPADQAVSANSAVYIMGLDASDSFDVEGSCVWSWTKQIAVDSPDAFTIAMSSPAKHLFLRLTGPDGKRVAIPAAEQSFWPTGDERQPGSLYNFQAPATGMYTLKVMGLFFPEGVDGQALLDSAEDIHEDARAVPEEQIAAHFTHNPRLHANRQHGLVVIWNNSTDVAWTHLSNYNMKVGESVELVARMTQDENNGTLLRNPMPQADVVSQALLEVLQPDGSVQVSAMHDDGLHNDGEANDGIFAGAFTPGAPGKFNVQAFLKGKHENGVEFIRTSQHVIRVTDSKLALTGNATVSLNETADRAVFHIGVENAEQGTTYRAYAQVWAVANNRVVPVAWISSLVDGGSSTFDLELDLKWDARAKVHPPYTLKEVLVQEMDTLDVVAEAAVIDVHTAASVHRKIVNTIAVFMAKGLGEEITTEMREGVAPPHIAALRQSNAAANLLMIHGFCADKNIWQVNSQQFDNAVYYLKPKASMSNDEFAKDVLSYVDSQGVTKFSCAGFSQGGLVCTHIFNYYFSGLDAFGANPSGRPIQSLASPFLGSTSASVGSALIDLFGGDCNSVADLTLEGAALWGTGITSTTRSQLYSISTQYKDKFLSAFCNGWLNLVQKSDNDGPTEKVYAQLPGSTWVHHDQGWCHTEDSKYPVSWSNVAYLKEINSQAAR